MPPGFETHSQPSHVKPIQDENDESMENVDSNQSDQLVTPTSPKPNVTVEICPATRKMTMKMYQLSPKISRIHKVYWISTRLLYRPLGPMNQTWAPVENVTNGTT